jgi:hypothetical protein
MKSRTIQTVLAAVVAGLLGFGGMSIAAAQDDGSTSTTQDSVEQSPDTTVEDDATTDDSTPDDDSTAQDHTPSDENCPNMGGDSADGSASGSTQSSRFANGPRSMRNSRSAAGASASTSL